MPAEAGMLPWAEHGRHRSLPFRMEAVPFGAVAARWDVILSLLAGSLFGAWLGAGLATKLRSEILYRVIAAMLVAIAAVLLVSHHVTAGEPLLAGPARLVAGAAAGFAIGVAAAVRGVAGGELLIPTLISYCAASLSSWPAACRWGESPDYDRGLYTL